MTHGGLTPALLGKTFFSTRRPAHETGGQRPTARCALGRESVWMIVLAFCAGAHNWPSYPAKAGYPVRRGFSVQTRRSGILDHPPSRAMTATDGSTQRLQTQDRGQRHCSTICRKSLVGYSIG